MTRLDAYLANVPAEPEVYGFWRDRHTRAWTRYINAVNFVNARARGEGWAIFDSDTRGFEVEADFDSEIFRDRRGHYRDDRALTFVRAKARRDGSKLHKLALLLTGETHRRK